MEVSSQNRSINNACKLSIYQILINVNGHKHTGWRTARTESNLPIRNDGRAGPLSLDACWRLRALREEEGGEVGACVRAALLLLGWYTVDAVVLRCSCAGR